MYRILLIVLIGLLACSEDDSNNPNSSPEVIEFDFEGSIRVDGFNRNYVVHLPPNYSEIDEAPLILTLHGGGGTAGTFSTLSNMNPAADDAGYIVVYPEGYEKFWADGRGGTPADAVGIDDVRFIEQLIDELSSELKVDTDRIYSTGISNGGGMSQLLACEIPSRIAGIAVVAHSMIESVRDDCTNTIPIPTVIIMGTQDPLNPFSGGVNAGGDAVIGASAAVEFRLGVNDCTNQTDGTVPNVSTMDQTTTSIDIYTNCINNAEMRLYTVDNGGHTWPRFVGGQYLPISQIGRVSNDFEASVEILKFFDSLQ